RGVPLDLVDVAAGAGGGVVRLALPGVEEAAALGVEPALVVEDLHAGVGGVVGEEDLPVVERADAGRGGGTGAVVVPDRDAVEDERAPVPGRRRAPAGVVADLAPELDGEAGPARGESAAPVVLVDKAPVGDEDVRGGAAGEQPDHAARARPNLRARERHVAAERAHSP